MCLLVAAQAGGRGAESAEAAAGESGDRLQTQEDGRNDGSAAGLERQGERTMSAL